MKKNIKLSFTLIISILFITSCASKVSDPKVDALANCLADKGVKEYGAFWCPNCAKQEQMFGASYSIIKERGVYIECDPRCDKPENELPIACRGIVGQPELCLEKGVDRYPHWEFQDGKVLLGVREFSELAENSGCQYEA